jgi:myo-inositol catabolism protein IolC
MTPEPEARKVLLTTVHAAREALTSGIENTQELLAAHDFTLGRTTRSNRMSAERLEQEIASMQAAYEDLDPEKP